MTPKVTVVGKTEFINPEHVPWETDAEGGEALVEFAGVDVRAIM